jgi:very-short-patch-repair endonuclease
VDNRRGDIAISWTLCHMMWTEIASRQSGVIRRGQLLMSGLSSEQVERLRRSRMLISTAHAGVYRAAGAPRTAASQAWTAVLGARAVLSYVSAAAWWDLPVEQDGRIHVTRRARQKFATHKLIRIHRTLLVPEAVTTRFGLRITTRTETLLDCLGWLPVPAARNLLDRAFQQGWLAPRDLDRRLDEQPGRWGNRQLAELARDCRPGVEAESERRLQRLLEQAGIRGWVANHPVRVGGHRFRPDIAFPDVRLAVEVDGWAYHRTKEQRDSDVERDNLLMLAGWRVLRFTWEDVRDRPEYILATIRSVLVTSRAI